MNSTPPRTIPCRRLREDAKLPTRAHPDDAGLDLYAVEALEIAPGTGAAAPTGVAVAVPEGFVGLVQDRSSMAKRGLKTAGGVIDAGYRGELRVLFWNLSSEAVRFEAGERIAQLLVVPIATPAPAEARELEATARGAKGFGSTGR